MAAAPLRQAAFSWLEQFERGRLVMGIDPDDLQRSLRSVDSLSRSLTIGVIVAGQLAALAVVLAVVVSDSLSEAPSSSRCWRSSDFSRSG